MGGCPSVAIGISPTVFLDVPIVLLGGFRVFLEYCMVSWNYRDSDWFLWYNCKLPGRATVLQSQRKCY